MVQPIEVINAIIAEQSQIIGEGLAKQVAQPLGVLNSSLDSNKKPQDVVTALINAYGNVFGQASINVCLDVIKRFPSNEIAYMLPDNLR